MNRILKSKFVVPVVAICLIGILFLAGHVNAQQTGELIQATGIDGTVGYIYAKDLQDAGYGDTNSILRDLDTQKAEAASKAGNNQYLSLIPLYAEDGETVIGQYGIGYMGGDYNADTYRVDAGLLESEYPVQAYHDTNGNVHLVEMDISEIEPYLTAEGNEYYAYMQIETAEPELIPVILEARRRIIYQDRSGWVDDSVDGCIRNEDGEIIEILPHFHEIFPSDWEIPWYPPEYNPKGSAYNP